MLSRKFNLTKECRGTQVVDDWTMLTIRSEVVVVIVLVTYFSCGNVLLSSVNSVTRCCNIL